LATAAAVNPTPTPNRPAAPAADVPPPLPSKEETLREIQAEAVRKEAEIRLPQEGKETERRRLAYDERRKSRDELREALRTSRHPASAIDDLCLHYRYQFDPEDFSRASRVWATSTRSTTAKIRMVRALDLPEPVILNFLSDDLHALLRSR